MTHTGNLAAQGTAEPLRRWARRVRALGFRILGGKKRVILQLSYARSGSSLLDACLGDSPGVGTVGEILHHTANNGRSPAEWWWPATMHLRVMPSIVREAHVVLKVHLTHLKKHGITVKDAVAACRPQCIVLHYRDDSLSQYVSQLLASKTRAFRKVDMRPGDEVEKVELVREKFGDYLALMDTLYIEAQRDLIGTSYCVVRHEDVVSNPVEAVQKPLSRRVPGLVVPEDLPMERQGLLAPAERLVNPVAIENISFDLRLSSRVPSLAQCGWFGLSDD